MQERSNEMSKCLNKVELTFFPLTIPPKENSKVLFFEFGELKTGSFFDGRFYCHGVICFPDCWGYLPEKPEDVGP
jgi:hypothetical protein